MDFGDTAIAKVPVVIVGAGPTGLVLANLLGMYGVQTLVIEANDATVSQPRAVSIDDESLRVMDQIELLPTVMSELVSGYGSEYLGPDGSVFLRVKPSEEPYGHPRRNAFRQPVLEAQLREGLERFDTVQVCFENRVVGFANGGDGVLVSIRERDGRLWQVKAQFLIGCDGSWSSTREALGFKLDGDSLDEKWLILDLEDSPVRSADTTVYCDPRRPGISLPGPRQTRRYEFKLMPGESEAHILSDEVVRDLMDRHDAHPQSRIIRKAVYHFHARVANAWGRNRVWLAGDAAHLMPPFAGQGMNGGIRDAANIAWKLASIIKGQFGPGLLWTYEQERRAHIVSMTRLALRMGRIFGPKTAFHGLLIRTAFRALGFWPDARRYFAEMRYKPAPQFRDGFLIAKQRTSRGLVGRMLPQPRLEELAAGKRLDDLLGLGFSLVGIGMEPGDLEQLSFGPFWDELLQRRVPLRGRNLGALEAFRGSALIVRPDRYVMGVVTHANIAAVREQLDALVDGTWFAPALQAKAQQRHLQALVNDALLNTRGF